MPARSKAQQRLFGIVHAIQKGEASPKGFSRKIREMAKRVDPEDAKHFAATKTDKLPEKKASFLQDAFLRGYMSRITESTRF